MSVHHVHTGPEKHLRSLRAGVLDGCKPPYEGRFSVTPLTLFPLPCRTAGIFQTPNKKTFHLFLLPFHPTKLSLSFQPVKIFSGPNSVTECTLSGAFREGLLGSFFGGEGGSWRASPFRALAANISCSVIGPPCPSLRRLCRFCNLS